MDNTNKFQALGIRADLAIALRDQGILEPTPIQEKTIPVVLAGSDLIAEAQTGTGKTLSFLLPVLERIDPHNPRIQALIVTPTRELALQITAEVKKLLAYVPGLHVLPVYGGQDVEQQMRQLEGSIQVVIGTPGRLLDHLRRGTIELTQVSMLVLDEADQMLHMGFLGEVEQLLEVMPAIRQTLLFSATMPELIRNLAVNFMRTPEEIQVRGRTITVRDIRQIVVETTDRAKQATLCQLIDTHRPYLAILFCRTIRRASKLNAALQELGYRSDELHGDLSQAKREQVMQQFRDARIQLLVATDVAARGLDVDGVTHVFNYDIPHDVESYIHRIGRTGRAGGKGLAITLVAAKDQPFLRMIEEGIDQSLKRTTIDHGQAQPAAPILKSRISSDNGGGQRAKGSGQGRSPARRGEPDGANARRSSADSSGRRSQSSRSTAAGTHGKSKKAASFSPKPTKEQAARRSKRQHTSSRKGR